MFYGKKALKFAKLSIFRKNQTFKYNFKLTTTNSIHSHNTRTCKLKPTSTKSQHKLGETKTNLPSLK